jgi:hypothetical protein
MKLAISTAMVALAVAPACKGDGAATRAKKLASAESFWPEAPKPTVTNAKRTLAYQPANIKGYTIDIDVGSLPGAEATVKVRMNLGIEFVAGDTPTMRKGMLRSLSMDMDAAGETMDMSFDGNTIRVKSGVEEPVVINRGDTGMPITVEDIADQPTALLDFRTDGTVVATPTEDNLELDNSLDSALILFPDLPVGEIAAGHKWKVKRRAQLANNLGSVDVLYDFVYAGDGPCPSGAGTCAHLTFTAASSSIKFEAQGHSGTGSYGFAGKVFINDKGATDESRVRMEIDVDVEGHKLPMGGTFTVKPT